MTVYSWQNSSLNQKEESEIHFVNNQVISHFSAGEWVFKMATVFIDSYDPGKSLSSDLCFAFNIEW